MQNSQACVIKPLGEGVVGLGWGDWEGRGGAKAIPGVTAAVSGHASPLSH